MKVKDQPKRGPAVAPKMKSNMRFLTERTRARPRPNVRAYAREEMHMTGHDEHLSMSAINLCRNINRKAANEYAERGISPEDIALAALYSAFDIAEAAKGPGMAAVEWLRTGLDLIERQMLSGEPIR